VAVVAPDPPPSGTSAGCVRSEPGPGCGAAPRAGSTVSRGATGLGVHGVGGTTPQDLLDLSQPVQVAGNPISGLAPAGGH